MRLPASPWMLLPALSCSASSAPPAAAALLLRARQLMSLSGWLRWLSLRSASCWAGGAPLLPTPAAPISSASLSARPSRIPAAAPCSLSASACSLPKPQLSLSHLLTLPGAHSREEGCEAQLPLVARRVRGGGHLAKRRAGPASKAGTPCSTQQALGPRRRQACPSPALRPGRAQEVQDLPLCPLPPLPRALRRAPPAVRPAKGTAC